MLQKAVRLLRATELGDAYERAWQDWDEADGSEWDASAADGLGAA